MPITLDTTTLPPDLVWLDEYAWQPVGQSAEHTLSGALVVETTAKQAGRTITLGRAWASKAEVDALRLLVLADAEMVLELHDERTFSVRWDHDGPAMSAEPVVEYADPGETDFYEITLKFIEV